MRFFNSCCHLRTAVVVLLVLFGLAVSSSPCVGDTVDSQTVGINLNGIPGPYSFDRFCRPNHDELWAVGGNGIVKHTNRSGTTEQQITDKSLNGIYFATTNVGWIVGDDGTILFTKDRGSNWEKQNSFVTNDIQAINCVSENMCWAVGNDGLILRTVDQGTHWEIVKAGTSAFLSAVNFVDGQIGWVVGEKGLIFRTLDGGKSWEQQRVIIPLFPDGPFAQPTDLRAVKFVNKTSGWIAGTGGVARTLDGGRTWEVKELGHTPLIGVVTIDGITVWAISSKGQNYVSKDHGVTWVGVRTTGRPKGSPL